MSNLLSELEAQSKWLRKVAAEIAEEGHNGWGNTCLQAADVIDTHHAEIAAAVRKCGLHPNAEQTAAAYREYLSLNDGDEDKAKQDLGTLVMGWHAAMSARESE